MHRPARNSSPSRVAAAWPSVRTANAWPAASGEGLKVWDAQTGQEILTLKVRTGGAVAFSPDGKRLASSSHLRPGSSEIKVWDAQTGQELLTFEGNAADVIQCGLQPGRQTPDFEFGRGPSWGK